ncbi:MAG TPA: hypothetical protein ENI32_05510 [Candidatus Syntrophoarchaeum butanivorans]|uniref:PEF-CTERM protein sorting domain-containing protein n=1 Tax=Candidatus Syntropharchaeum butanivorans TaxID=1839936 RepID=A0A1F2P502_9EURY|nr:MAG: conserved hypothetical protein, secreted [Candidatus Syntrophoarchaeum butanivorans]HEC57321.1 hypothetical protein [Candidatus Syntrophoarchaeum butanivorans]
MEAIRSKFAVTLILGVTVLVGMMAAPAAGDGGPTYTIDGDPTDWGIHILTGNWSLNETWVPKDGVEFIVEDNRDPRWGGITGVHIKGVGSSYTRYYEDKVRHRDGYLVAEPYSDEPWDLEAKYLDEDDEFIYVLIVTSLDPDATGDYAPGDLALDLDGNSSTGKYGYEYGVKLGTNTGLSQGDIYYLPDWEEPTYIPENRPSVFNGYLSGGYKNGTATVVYKQISVDDNGHHNYVIEMAIPKLNVSMAGKSLKDPPTKTIHICDGCGNEHIDNSIPEFLSIAIPAAAVVGLFYYKRREQKGRGE